MPNLHGIGRRPILLVALALLCLSSCGAPWQATIEGPDGGEFVVNHEVLETYGGFATDEGNVPLERMLYAAGHRLIERLTITATGGDTRVFDWATVAEAAYWRGDGRLAIGDQVLPVARLEVEPPALLERVEAHITDIAPTAAAVLGIPAPAAATGSALPVPRASHVLLLFLDGFGYLRYTEAVAGELVPELAALGEPLVGLTVYPPATSVASAATLAGAGPGVTGVDRRGIRKTEFETLFDVAAAAGLEVEAVEGDALAFNLRGAEMQLSGDRDGNGSTDDNVLGNALAALAGGMPDLLWVHLHGIDDAGHAYGPGAAEEAAAVREVAASVGQILDTLPDDTMVIAFADHGMHSVEEEGRLGNHGHLIERDMLIPVFLALKDVDGKITPYQDLGGK